MVRCGVSPDEKESAASYMCYKSRLLISKFNARGSGYVLEYKFTKYSEIR